MHESSIGRNAVEVLAEEFVARYRAGERPPVSEYTDRFPEFAEEIRDLFPAMLLMENLKPVEDDVAPPPEQAPLGLSQMGDYRIIREVGRGGMGVVYEAEQISLGRHVALKVLPREMVANPSQRMRFEREAKAAAKLHHSNIVPVFGVGNTDGQLYYVMQFIQGLALDEVLLEIKRIKSESSPVGNNASTGARQVDQRHQSVEILAQSLMAGSLLKLGNDEDSVVNEKDVTVIATEEQSAAEDLAMSPSTTGRLSESFSLSQSLSGSTVTLPRKSVDSHTRMGQQTTYSESIAEIGVQVARALEYAHSQGVLHRDIKPANLVLDMKGTVWVTDFGLAKLDDDHGLTQVGDILGTLRYMSPESFKGKGDVRSEVYSLGLTLYELLAFRPAFDQTRRNALIDQVMHAEVRPLRQANPDVPSDLQQIIHKAIDRDPQHRYQSAGELADDLQRFIDDDPIMARRVTLLERFNRWSRRNKSLAASLAIVSLLITILAVGSTIAAGYFRSVNSELNSTVVNLKQTQNSLNTTVAELTTTTGKLTVATRDAEKKAAENLKLARAAESAQRASQTTLADMQTEHGLMSAAQGDNATAMLWFANAAGQTPHDLRRQTANLLRARNAMNQSPRPVAMLPQAIQGSLSRMEFQPYGQLLLALKMERLQIWNWDLEQSLPWSDAIQNVTDAVWSPDGRRVALGFTNGEVQIRAVPSGETVHHWQHSESVESLCYSRSGHRLAVAGRTLRIWNVEADLSLDHETSHPDIVHSITFNKTGSRIATACRDNLVRVFSLTGDNKNLAPLFSPLPHAPEIESPPVFVDADHRVITICDQQRIGWWDAETGQPAVPQSADLSSRSGRRLVASRDGNWFAVAADPPVVWNISGNRSIRDHVNHVRDVVFSADGSTLATGCMDWMARQWSVANATAPPVVLPQMEAVETCAFSDDGTHFAVAGWDVIRIWKLPEKSPEVVGHAGWNYRFRRPRPSFDGRWVTPGFWHQGPSDAIADKRLKVVEASTGQPVGPEIELDEIIDSCICADNKSVAVIGRQGGVNRLSIIDVASGQDLLPKIDLPGPPQSVAARPLHSDVAVLCQTGHIVIVDQRDGARRRQLATPGWEGEGRHSRVTYTPDGRTLIVVAARSEIEVYDADTGTLRFNPIHPLLAAGICRAIDVSSDSRWLATGVNGRNAVQVWDLSTGKAVSDPLPHPGDYYGIFAVAFSPDGKWVLSGNKDGRARLWNWKTGKLVCPPLQHPDEVLDVAFTQNGQHALTAVRNGTLRVWELQTGKLIAPPVNYERPHETSTETIAVAGTHAIVGGYLYPVINLNVLLEPPTLSAASLRSLAELTTGRRLELGELNGLSANEWRDLWVSLRSHEFTPLKIAESFAQELDRTSDATTRLMIAERAAKSETVLTELIRLRSSVPQLHVALSKIQAARKDPSAAKTREHVIELYEQQLDQQPGDDFAARQLADLIFEISPSIWRNLCVSKVKSSGGAVFSRREDGAFVVSGNDVTSDVYSLEVRGVGTKIATIRLDVLPDPSLPHFGPGRHSTGNFQLAAFRLYRSAKDGNDERVPIPVANAQASYTWPATNVNIRGTIDPQLNSVWHVWGRQGHPHHAVFILERPLILDHGDTLTIELTHYEIGAAINLGCFRLSASDDPHAFEKEQEVQFLKLGTLAGAVELAAAYLQANQLDKALTLLTPERKDKDSAAAGVRLLLLAELHQQLAQQQPLRESYDQLVAWLKEHQFPIALQDRATRLMIRVGGLTAQQAAAIPQFYEVNRQLQQLTREIERDPQMVFNFYRRAECYARLGRWREAATDHISMTVATPMDRMPWLRAAPVLLLADDTDGYKALCRGVLAQFPDTKDPFVADVIIKLALLVPGTIPISDLPTATLKEILIDPEATSKPWFVASCALIALREDRYQEAVEITQRLGNSPSGQFGALALIVRAMAQHHLQQAEQAQSSLEQAERLIPQELRTLGTELHISPLPVEPIIVSHDWLIPELLRREAAQVIQTSEPRAN